LYRFPKGSNGAFGITRALSGKSESDLSRKPIWFQADSGLQFLQRFHIFRLSGQNFCQVIVRRRVTGRKLDRLTQLCGSFLVSMLLQIDDPQVQVSRGKLGLQTQSFRKRSRRLGYLALLGEDGTEIIPEIVTQRAELDGPAHLRSGFGM